MKYSPILFSTEMVQAIIEGRKTQTRRVVKQFLPIRLDKGNNYAYTDKFVGTYESAIKKCPYGQIGDRIWVRETWADVAGIMVEKDQFATPVYAFRASKKAFYKGVEIDTYAWNWDAIKWKPSIFMPRDACRITLEITDVRIEQLKSISESDAISEGVYSIRPVEDLMYFDYNANEKESPSYFDTAFESFRSLWYKINGYGSWESNPYVWVVEFKVVQLGKMLFS